LTEHGQTLRKFRLPLEADPEILSLEEKIGRLNSLLGLRTGLTSLEAAIRAAQWRCDSGSKVPERLRACTSQLTPEPQRLLSVPN
jgi:hypothetical protein